MHRPSPFTRHQLLTDLLCNPVAMRGPEHYTLVHNLLARSDVLHEVRANMERNSAEEEPMPWEAPAYTINQGIAIVPIFGPLMKGYDDFICWYLGLMSTDRLQRTIAELAARTDVAGVIFHINSPGGVGIGIPETAFAIDAIGATKPTFAFTADQACSAAYWLAAACTKIFCTPSATMGSIGTYLALYDYTEALSDAGIKLELFVRGKYKAIGLEGNPLTPDHRAFLEQYVSRFNSLFTEFVSAFRPGVSADMMQGQWFDGEQALALGLADRVVSGLPDLLAQLTAALQPARVILP